MYELTIEEKVKIKRLINIVAILIILSIAFLFGKYLSRGYISESKAAMQEKAVLQTQVDSLKADINGLNDTIKNSKKALMSLETDENEYINLAGELSKTYNVKLSKFEISPVKKNNKIGSLTTCIELEGSFANIKAFITDFCKNTNAIKTLSLRQKDEFIWLKREIDKNIILNWFDSDNIENVRDFSEQSQSIAEPQTNTSAKPMSVDTLFNTAEMRCYLEIDFIGLN